MRNALATLLVVVGFTWALLAGNKVGLIIAFAGMSLLTFGVVRGAMKAGDGEDGPIF